MSDTARDYQSIQPASTEGLDDFFADATQRETTASQFQTDATRCEAVDLQCEAVATQCKYTIVEASQVLKVSPSTVYRRVKAGKYSTVTDSDGVLKVIVPRNATQHEAVDLQCETDATQCEATVTTDNELAKALIEMTHKLTHATYRNGWLESKLEELQKDIEQRDQHIKLLTDSQHKPKWWHRIRFWIARQ